MKANLEKTTAAGVVLTSCPICESDRLKQRWEVNGYKVVACEGCSLVFVQNLPTPEQLEAHYSAAPGDDVYFGDNVECLKFYYQKLRKLIEARVPQKGKILDIGCSGGWFLDEMEGWERHGNEIIPADAAFARKRHGDNIVTGRFEDYPMKEGYFDFITLQDVFDHFPDPVAVLEKCNKMLKPGGGIVIKVHNISCLYAKLSGSTFYAIIPPSHLVYYDSKTLSRILSKTGFRMTDTRYIAHILKIKTVFLRLAKSRDSLLYRLSNRLAGGGIGDIKFRKNLRDVVTVFGVKSA